MSTTSPHRKSHAVRGTGFTIVRAQKSPSRPLDSLDRLHGVFFDAAMRPLDKSSCLAQNRGIVPMYDILRGRHPRIHFG